MQLTNIIYEEHDCVAKIIMNRQKALNALSTDLLLELEDCIKRAEKNDQVVAIVITGSGDKTFSVSADVQEFKGMSTSEVKKYITLGKTVMREIRNSTKPVIALVNGVALGGDCELARACDIQIAAEHAKFGQPEVKLGIIPSWGGTQMLPQLIGFGKAKELIFTGDTIDAQEAKRLGLIDEIASKSELWGTSSKLTSKIKESSPIAVKNAKLAVNKAWELLSEPGFT